jgi:oxygen-independent coproporphyrinogen-3 oxidase
MSGIYIHIPFCKQACHYCDFHFSTTVKKQPELVEAIIKELFLRKNEMNDEAIETIYLGGGTPSLLTEKELSAILEKIDKNFKIVSNPEITLEANPDDLTLEKIKQYHQLGINRLSIGVQSFFEEDLQLMNRAHHAQDALNCLTDAKKYFDNISLDLIYGIPGLSNERWLKNIETALSFEIPHISSYALTVEKKTALEHLIKVGKINQPCEDVAHEQFHLLIETLEKNDFVHYELSNFGKENYFSKNNSAYWQGKSYLGIGPSAHSFDGKTRSWNVSNNSQYIKALSKNELAIERETLSQKDQFNEYIMTGLRTIWGVSLGKIEKDFGDDYLNHTLKCVEKPIQNGYLKIENNILKTTKSGKFLTDGLASELFFV